MDTSLAAVRQRLASYSNAQIFDLADVLQFAIKPLSAEEQEYIRTLRCVTVEQLLKRELGVDFTKLCINFKHTEDEMYEEFGDAHCCMTCWRKVHNHK